jgi:hypothetical protein
MLIALRKLGTLTPTGISAGRSQAVAYTIRSLGNSNAGALLSFGIPERAFITLDAYTAGGRQIARLARGEYPAGEHSVALDRDAMPPGAVVLRLNSGSNSTALTILPAAP